MTKKMFTSVGVILILLFLTGWPTENFN